MDINIGINDKDRKAIADGLAHVLADTYSLYLKTHNYHWNVTGPMFQTLHLMFEGQYTELALAVDAIAERIRSLGHPAPGSYAAFAKLSRVADVPVSCYPNAGLPNDMGEYDDTPEHMARVVREFAEAGFLNIVGGCCGTTPEHIRAIHDAVARCAPRTLPDVAPAPRLSGLEPFHVRAGPLFVNVGDRLKVDPREGRYISRA